MSLLIIWVVYAIFGTTAFSVLFLWAVRTRQFSDFERPRLIPLEKNEADNAEKGHQASTADRYTWLVMAAITIGVLVSVVWIGIRNG